MTRIPVSYKRLEGVLTKLMILIVYAEPLGQSELAVGRELCEDPFKIKAVQSS